MNKYKAIKTVVDGITFDSKKEAGRYSELKLLQKAGEISGLCVQPKYNCAVNGKHICAYTADFSYTDPFGVKVVEDVKSPATRKNPVYRLKKKLVEDLWPITIHEV